MNSRSFARRVNRIESPRSHRASSGTHLVAHRRWLQTRCPRPCDTANNGSSQTWRKVDALHSQPRDIGSFHGRASRSPPGVTQGIAALLTPSYWLAALPKTRAATRRPAHGVAGNAGGHATNQTGLPNTALES